MTGDTSSGGGGYSGYIQGFQQMFGGHPAGSGRSASRAAQQIAYASMRLAQQQAALSTRRFREQLEAGTEHGMAPEVPIITPIIPTRLSTQLTRVMGPTSQGKMRPNPQAVKIIQTRIDRYLASHPDAFTVEYVRNRSAGY